MQSLLDKDHNDLLFKKASLQPISEETQALIQGATILVTGAGGSIGAALAKQILNFLPAKLILLELSEYSLYQLNLELTAQVAENKLVFVLGDVKDAAMMNELFEDHRPQLVFHTAALKHVALLEQHIQAAFENNLLGTCILARTAVQFGVRKVITLSTDKAVNPTSIMGVSKRLAELALIEMSARDTSFISVRFGNVIGSRGSVIPLFQEQIRRREPVTVTDPQVSRYFLSISEAVRIILEAAWLGEGCEVFMPDLMKSIKILEIAEYLIQQAGLIPAKDIPIVFTGLRPGEKMFEELVYTRETLSPTSRPGILRVEEPVGPAASAEQWISEVEELLGQRKLARLLVRICELVPEYRPSAEILGKVKALPSHLEND